jgi:Rha family phage regulatory protein
MTQFVSTSVTPPIVSISNNRVIATSIDIAAYFKKRHDNVLQSIQNLLKQLTGRYLLNFQEIQIDVDLGLGRTRKDTAYQITRDGFALLAMGFTGKQALQFKLDFIDSYNAMEAEILRVAKFYPFEEVPIAQDSINVRELMLSGQSDPVALSWDVEKEIDAKAWEMAKEAFEISREHLKRRVAYSPGNKKQLIQRGNLNEALAHTFHEELGRLRNYTEAYMFSGNKLIESIDRIDQRIPPKNSTAHLVPARHHSR